MTAPKFIRRGRNSLKRVKLSWRKPMGIDNKLRRREKSKGRFVSIGYGTKKEERGVHPCGLREVYVQNIKDLETIDAKTQAARLDSTLGKRKKTDLLKKADELKIKVLNK